MKISGLLVVLGALASGASSRGAAAQPVCWAGTRDLSALSARAYLAELAVRGRWDRNAIADAVGCALHPEQLVGATADFGPLPLNVSIQPITVRTAYVGGLADPRNNGPEWTGRGLNGFVRTGVSFDAGWLHFIAAPHVWYAENRAYDIIPSVDAQRSAFASPWYSAPFSIDLPSRFGTRAITQIDPGESAVWLRVGPIDAGAGTSTQHWGPGERGGLILGPDAPGIPRLFVRTPRPLTTPIGSFSATAFAGTLTPSRYFTRDNAGELRSLTAWTVAWSPGDSSTFVVGVADAWMQLGTRFGEQRSSQSLRGPTDRISEIYAQFRDPNTGIRVWTEIGRAGGLPTLRRFLTVPYQGIAYVVGVDRAVTRRDNVLVISAEAANLEQPTDVRGEISQDFYTSSTIPQGWTQRGQLLGYPTGPGSQAQWLSLDWVGARSSFGLFGEHVRWNEDALTRQYLAYPNRHDVTLRGGARGGFVWLDTEFALEASVGRRLSYLFQNADFIPGYRTVDVAVPELRFLVTPAGHGRP